ncbi:hypothetical protein pipiens_007214 [Culex pipiens pipiens]|uniref:Uncharacterized protein n=1 Tax=Culex pipiens pipiens TaxID=38569 RepID=A0ABD1DLT0_CULPP
MPATDERKSVCRLARRIRLQTRESPKDYIRRCSGRYLNQCCRKHQETDLDEGQSNSNKLVVTVNRTRVASDADGNLFKFKVWHIQDLKTSQLKRPGDCHDDFVLRTVNVHFQTIQSERVRILQGVGASQPLPTEKPTHV